MDPSAFKSTAAGRPRKTVEGYWAFIPAAPPEQIAYDPELALALSQADTAIGELSGLGQHLPNPDLLIEPYARREAVASSQIEGTQARLDDLLFDEIAPDQTPATSDVREVRNYLAALKLGVKRLAELPLSGRLVRELHRVLMDGVRGEHAAPGAFRHTQNWIGPPGCTLATATYVPPPPDDMHQCIKQWEIFINKQGVMPDLVQCAIMHEHFESIHPFIDGNRRIGRLMITLFLIQRRRLSKPLLYISSYIEAHRQEYYDLLQGIRTDGNWRPWLHYFLIAVRETARAAIAQGTKLLALRDAYRDQLKADPRAAALLDLLFENPYVTVARTAELLHVSKPTAKRCISALEKIGLLAESTGRDWHRIWVAAPILAAVR